jgi:SMI1/KNR4 family protein SUKH-1
MMEVNGLKLPDAFARFVSQPDADMEMWELRGDHDAYGKPLETDFKAFTKEEQIAARTAWLPYGIHFHTDTEADIARRDTMAADWPGAIPYIRDFARIIQFGENGAGNAFCFGFRENPTEPSVIYYNDFFWQRVAPNFESFAALLQPFGTSGPK